MANLLATIKLRNIYRVYKEGKEYRVVQEDRHGEQHTRVIPEIVTQFLYNRYYASEVVVSDAATALEKVADASQLPYHYGHKLQYYTQTALLALMAARRATVKKRGRQYVHMLQ